VEQGFTNDGHRNDPKPTLDRGGEPRGERAGSVREGKKQTEPNQRKVKRITEVLSKTAKEQREKRKLVMLYKGSNSIAMGGTLVSQLGTK